MKKLTFDFNTPQIDINGHIFELKVSDMDVLETALEASEEFRNINKDDVKAIIAAVRKCEHYIDTMLGEGALCKISGGKPVNLMMAIKIMTEIAHTAAAAYNEKINDEYGILSE